MNNIFKYCGECSCCINLYNDKPTTDVNHTKKTKLDRYVLQVIGMIESKSISIELYDDEFAFTCTGTIVWGQFGSTSSWNGCGNKSINSYFITNYGRLLNIHGPYGFNETNFKIIILNNPDISNPIKLNQEQVNILNNLLETNNILLQYKNTNITYNEILVHKLIKDYNQKSIKPTPEFQSHIYTEPVTIIAPTLDLNVYSDTPGIQPLNNIIETATSAQKAVAKKNIKTTTNSEDAVHKHLHRAKQEPGPNDTASHHTQQIKIICNTIIL